VTTGYVDRFIFVGALRLLPPRQRAVLILCEVLRWKPAEVAPLLDTSIASVDEALRRARSTIAASVDAGAGARALDEEEHDLVARYADAFECYDLGARLGGEG
jgi:RNA polymerase sigma-70 factor (ECF subfamily)